MTTTDVATYAQAIDIQTRLVQRGELLRIEHDVVEGHFCPDGTTHILCSCGRGMWRPDDQSEPAWASHVLEALRRDLAVAA
ncbi:hypothetical protein [Amnibacterium kyonggiense]|uniref:Uncharacterized protein n=1 Tax=Amnibacterium kyonggiense TaxID=595671 RepID=A0A4R7FHS9_9MICO|nr:hypothetical protein [Amnibacterium kyonggiense]TDS75914.1 hypothetical protein CLV52_3025 [Amnibacterium kyonggiense]